MDDSISRQTAIDALNAIRSVYRGTCSIGLSMAIDTLRDLPSAQPEIIHCEECTYRKDNFMGDWCACWCGWTSLDGYCHKGANKDE